MDYNHTRILLVRFQLIEFYLRAIINKLRQDSEDSSFILYSFKNYMKQETKILMLSIIRFILGELIN
jgi:hypothetical protein